MVRRHCKPRWPRPWSRARTARSASTPTDRRSSTTGSSRSPRLRRAATSPESRPSFACRRWTRRSVASSARRRRRPAGPTQLAPRRRRRPGLETKHLWTSAPETCSTETDGVSAAPLPTESAAPILRLRGVGRRFGGLRAVADVTLEVKPGERRAILGPNGAGKTTLFNVISGDFPPTSGRIEFLGADVTQTPPRARAKLGMGRTYQKSRLLLGLSVEDNLYLAVLGVKSGHLRPVLLPGRDREMRERARELATAVGLEGRESTLVGSLSHGEQRQLEVAMARASNPKLMMLDEPASGLSRGERVALTDLLLTLDKSITLILIEHDMDVALRVAERVTMMHDGNGIAEGTPAEIRANQTVPDLYPGKGVHAA